jgi:hypothetical protein
MPLFYCTFVYGVGWSGRETQVPGGWGTSGTLERTWLLRRAAFLPVEAKIMSEKEANQSVDIVQHRKGHFSFPPLMHT